MVMDFDNVFNCIFQYSTTLASAERPGWLNELGSCRARVTQ